MRLIIECFVASFFCMQCLANMSRGFHAWEQWLDRAGQEWASEYAQRYCARKRAAELNFSAARDFWAVRSTAAPLAFQKAWDAWLQRLAPYEELSLPCDEEALFAKHEVNPSILESYPNWVVRYAPH